MDPTPCEAHVAQGSALWLISGKFPIGDVIGAFGLMLMKGRLVYLTGNTPLNEAEQVNRRATIGAGLMGLPTQDLASSN
jgi:hypothetical protein